MHIQRAVEAKFSDEYGGVTPDFGEDIGAGFRRLYPWRGTMEELPWGSGLMVVAPGGTSKAHAHNEHETFFIVSGRARCRIGDEVAEVSKNDVIYVPLNMEHELTNLSDAVPMEYLCIWWGGDAD